MTTPKFVQVHWLASYPGTLLNRDDAGLAKRLPFGGATRTRVSSQCLKRHWRKADDAHALASLGVPMGVRSRKTVEQLIVGPIAKPSGASEDVVNALVSALAKEIYSEGADDVRKRQALLLGRPEIEHLRAKAAEILRTSTSKKDIEAKTKGLFKAERKNLEAMKNAAGLEAALFGRMVTSDVHANTDAAVHVAHAFTVHAEESESDYFTVVDDLSSRDEGDDAGAAGVFDQELTSGLYYGYVVVDVPQLVENIEGVERAEWRASGTDRALAGRVVDSLLHLIATVSPGAKLGGTAPYAYADLVLVELGERQPRSLANAFRVPVPLRGDTLAGAMGQLAGQLGALDEAYGGHEARRVTTIRPEGIGGIDRMSLDNLGQWVARAITAGDL